MSLNKLAKPLMLLLAAYFLLVLPGIAAGPVTRATDCTEMDVQADIDPALSKDENLQRLSEMFYQSLNTVTHCDDSANDAATEAQSSTEGAVGNTVNGVAASDISGTESDESLSESTADYVSETDAVELDEYDMAENEAEAQGAGTKAPDDIPPADNDSIFEQQIREAAENETDPEVRARLWNEYRKYKGLPVKPVKEESSVDVE